MDFFYSVTKVSMVASMLTFTVTLLLVLEIIFLTYGNTKYKFKKTETKQKLSFSKIIYQECIDNNLERKTKIFHTCDKGNNVIQITPQELDLEC